MCIAPLTLSLSIFPSFSFSLTHTHLVSFSTARMQFATWTCGLNAVPWCFILLLYHYVYVLFMCIYAVMCLLWCLYRLWGYAFRSMCVFSPRECNCIDYISSCWYICIGYNVGLGCSARFITLCTFLIAMHTRWG